MYAKYANNKFRDVTDIGGKNGVVLSTNVGDIILYSDEYVAGESLVIESRAKEASVTVSVPLARHLRILSDIYGYETVSRLVNEMPDAMRGGSDE